jgi:hypothetical protein
LEGPLQEQIRVVSNPVEIEILPNQENVSLRPGGETGGGFGGDSESLYMKVREAEVSVRHEGNPSLQLTKAVHDFGHVGPGTVSKAVFDFKNVGTGTLEVYGAQATCGCLNPTFILPLLIPQALNSIENKSLSKDNPLILQPGESARLEVNFTAPSSKGKFHKYLYLGSNDPVHPRSELEVVGEVIVKVEVSPEQVDLLLDQANGGMKEILLKSVDGRAFSIQEIKTPDSVMTIPFNPEIEAKQFLLEATVDIEKLAQSPVGAIQIVTDHPNGDKPIIRYNVPPYYKVSNPRLILQNVSPQQEIIRQVMVQGNYGKTVKIKSAQSRNGYMKIVNQQGSGEQVQLEIAVIPPKQDKGYFTDELTIVLDDGNELTIRCSGWFKKEAGSRNN